MNNFDTAWYCANVRTKDAERFCEIFEIEGDEIETIPDAGYIQITGEYIRLNDNETSESIRSGIVFDIDLTWDDGTGNASFVCDGQKCDWWATDDGKYIVHADDDGNVSEPELARLREFIALVKRAGEFMEEGQ